MRASPLARYLFAVYAFLTVYASLHPLAGWRDQGLSAFAFLAGAWPGRVSSFDVVANILGYAPYGALCVAALHPRLRGAAAVAIATLSGVLLSLLLEAAQSYLPARTASNLDLLCNAAGALAGAALAAPLVPRLMASEPLRRLRARFFEPGHDADIGLLLLGLWLFIQLNPTTLLFGAGDLRDWLVAPEGAGRAPRFFVGIEALVAAANLAALALLVSVLVVAGGPLRLGFLALVAAALVVKTMAFAVLMQAQNALAWATPGALIGLLLGCATALAALKLPPTARLAAAAVLLMAATVLVNLVPANPYVALTLMVWRQGHFLNFNGLTRVVGALWPFAVLGYLTFLAARRR